MDDQEEFLINHTSIEYYRELFEQFTANITSYYHQFRSSFSDKSNQRQLFLSILLSFIFLTIFTLILTEYKRLRTYCQRYIRYLSTFSPSKYIRLRKTVLPIQSTHSVLNHLLNSNNSVRDKFCHEFLRALNDQIINRKVIVRRTDASF